MIKLTTEELLDAIKSTEYKYFGDYEMSEGQRDAVDVLVKAANELIEIKRALNVPTNI